MTGPSHEPLDEQERELARVLRALPGAEPSAAVDQRILRAAADASAAAPARRRLRPWLAFGSAGWGIGGAAAAVLALGVGWHLLDPARNMSLERTAPVTVPARDENAPVTVTLGDREAPRSEAAATAPPPPAVRPQATLRATRPAIPAAAAPAPAFVPSPPPPPPPAPVENVAADAASPPAAAEAIPFPDSTGLTAEQVARLPAPERAREQAARKAAADTAARQAEAFEAEAAGLAAQQARATLGPDAWLAQVRALREDGRDEDAAASLRRFRLYYPQYSIPADLQPLLRE